MISFRVSRQRDFCMQLSVHVDAVSDGGGMLTLETAVHNRFTSKGWRRASHANLPGHIVHYVLAHGTNRDNQL